MGFSFPEESLGRTVMIRAIHSSPVDTLVCVYKLAVDLRK